MPAAVCALLLLSLARPAERPAPVVLAPVHYTWTVEVDYADEVLRATADVVLENPSAEPVAEASFLLYRLLRVRSVRDAAGDTLAVAQAVRSFEDFDKLQVNHVLVTLPAPLPPGARTTLRIAYEGPLLGYAETGMRYIQDRIDPAFTILRDDAFAYPQPGWPSFAVNRGAPDRRFTYDARITVPESLTVANGGRLAGVDTLGGAATYRYASIAPSWRMDFAVAAYTRVSRGPIHVFHLPGSEEGAAGVAAAAQAALDLFGAWFGDRPGTSTLTFIEIPDGWGSQADVTTIIQTSAAFRDPERHREVYHEVSHLWPIAPSERPSPRWNEGLASFLEYLVAQERTGEPVVDARAAQLAAWLRVQLPDHPAWREVALVDYGRHRLTDLSYSVGALFFDLLYRLVGHEAFTGMLARYVDRYGTDGGTTADFLQVVQAGAALDLSPLIHDWILTTAWADRLQEAPTVQDLAAYYRAQAAAPDR